jgi:hypothetical protein
VLGDPFADGADVADEGGKGLLGDVETDEVGLDRDGEPDAAPNEPHPATMRMAAMTVAPATICLRVWLHAVDIRQPLYFRVIDDPRGTVAQ